MKKFYSLMLAAGVAAGSLSVNAAPSSPTFSEKTTTNFRVDANNDLNLKNASFRAPAAQSEANFPASLDGKILNFSYSIIEGEDVFEFSRNVTLSDGEEQQGIIYYTMSSFLADVYNDQVPVYDLDVAYIPSEGAFVLLGSQNYISFPLADGTTADCEFWAADATGSCVRGNYFFNYENGQFILENPITVSNEDGSTEPFTIDQFLLGRVKNNRLSYYAALGADIKISIVDGTGNMTYTMTNNSGPQAREAEVAANVAGSTLTILGFAGMFDVPMTIDTQAKTLTATDVQVTAITDYKAYLSEQAADGSNAAGTRKYVLTSTYTVANGKTTINVPNWNAFFYQFGAGESSYFWPMTNTKIVLDLDLDTVAESGVEGIAADAEFDVNAPAEYFNLQGIRVATPEAGQLLIKRQGNKATKVVIR